MKFSRQRPEEVSVNLTPLIDVVFLLLIFFMVSTTFTKETQLEIDLPSASGSATEAHERIEILISAEGEYRLNSQLLAESSAEALKEALGAAAGVPGETPLVIAADANTPHQLVVTAMDVAGQLGYTRLSIITQESTK